VTPFWEDPIQPVVDIIGLDHVLYSSDWPHPEGLADPVGYYKFCEEEGLSTEAIKKIMGANMFDLMEVGVSGPPLLRTPRQVDRFRARQNPQPRATP
jgi:hypothetical protein